MVPVSADYIIYEHGWNGDWHFTEVVNVVDTLAEAKKLGERVMLKDRHANVLEDGTPTVQWVEVFGPEFEESLGCEMSGEGNLFWSGV